jgi:hypothetical protein
MAKLIGSGHQEIIVQSLIEESRGCKTHRSNSCTSHRANRGPFFEYTETRRANDCEEVVKHRLGMHIHILGGMKDNTGTRAYVSSRRGQDLV